MSSAPLPRPTASAPYPDAADARVAAEQLALFEAKTGAMPEAQTWAAM